MFTLFETVCWVIMGTFALEMDGSYNTAIGKESALRVCLIFFTLC